MKKIILDLENIKVNNIMLLLVFEREALKQNWTREEVDLVLKEAKKGNYHHILKTLKKYCVSKK